MFRCCAACRPVNILADALENLFDLLVQFGAVGDDQDAAAGDVLANPFSEPYHDQTLAAALRMPDDAALAPLHARLSGADSRVLIVTAGLLDAGVDGDAVHVEHDVGPLRILSRNRHLFGDAEVVICGIGPVDQPHGDVLFADIGPYFHTVTEQPINLAVRVVERLAAAKRRSLAQFEQDLADDLFGVAPAFQPVGERRLLNVAVVGPILPIAQVVVFERILKEGDHALLCVKLQLADVAHAPASIDTGLTSRTRPVRSCCIMPCLIALVLSRRRSSAAISASISERTVATAVCSSMGGRLTAISENTGHRRLPRRSTEDVVAVANSWR